jgi:hypothetical protein
MAYNAPMAEIVLVLLGLLLVGVLGLLAAILTPALLAAGGFWTLAAGLLLGLPTGVWYHVLLYRILAARMTLPVRWWASPSDLHRHLDRDDLRRIRPWYLLGGIGFLLCLGGGLAAGAGLLLSGP